jgi:GNAT superfamily N-acetyltransferase
MPSRPSSLVVAPACSDADVNLACDIMVEAADWLAARGQSLWNREALVPEKIRPMPEDGTLFLARLNDRPVGAFLLLFEDSFFWPDMPIGQALYLHKLVVRRAVAGTGVSRQLLEHAVGQTRSAGRSFLRLDCAPRPKLCAFYESAEFRYHSDRYIGSFAFRRYERSTQVSP